MSLSFLREGAPWDDGLPAKPHQGGPPSRRKGETAIRTQAPPDMKSAIRSQGARLEVLLNAPHVGRYRNYDTKPPTFLSGHNYAGYGPMAMVWMYSSSSIWRGAMREVNGSGRETGQQPSPPERRIPISSAPSGRAVSVHLIRGLAPPATIGPTLRVERTGQANAPNRRGCPIRTLGRSSRPVRVTRLNEEPLP